LSHVWLGLFAVFCRTAQSCSSTSPQDCYDLNLPKAEQFRGGKICTHCKIFLCDVVNTSLILGNTWLKGYTWLNVSIFQRIHEKKSSLGMERNDRLDFFSDLVKFKIQEQTRKRLFRSSCIIINHHNNNRRLAFSIWKVFEVFLWEKCSLCSHGEVN